MSRFVSKKAASFTESVIREMSRRVAAVGGLNLAQGFPDFDPPEELIEAAVRALRGGYNQYAVTWGTPNFRRAIAEKTTAFNKIPTDPDKNVTVTCGSTEAMIATMLAVLDPGDEVIVFEPFYENYGPDAILCGAAPRYVRMEPPHYRFDPDELRRACGARTKAIIVNTPHNPTGKVFTREELETIRDLAVEHDLLVLTDEIYEYILYDGREHVSPGSIEGLGDRTVTISGLSKTYSVTGWRLAYAVAPEAIAGAIRKTHDFLTVGAPHPLQEAGAEALRLPASYYEKLREDYGRRRAALLGVLREAGLLCFEPEGAYYVMTDVRPLLPGASQEELATFAFRLVDEIGLAGVPGTSFYRNRADGAPYLRFTFSKKDATLEGARARLARLKR